MPAFENQDELLKRAAANAKRVLGQVRDQRQDLDSNRHIDAAVGSKGSNALTRVEQTITVLLNDLNSSLAQTPKTDSK
jgi:hypothetical protein